MELRIAPPLVQCLHLPQSFATSSTASPSLLNLNKKGDTFACQIFLSNAYTLRTKLLTSQFLDQPVSRGNTIKRSCSENLDEILEEPAQGFDLSVDEENKEHQTYNITTCTISENSLSVGEYRSDLCGNYKFLPSKFVFLEPKMLGIRPEAPEWPEREAIIRTSIERKANRVDLPLSLRLIKKKQQLQEGFRDLEDSACCSVKKAFSSMVYIILELQSYALQMREVLCYKDLEKVIDKVKAEMNASFVWIFQHVFSRTPALMIHVMILLANFSVYSTANNVAIAETSFMGSSYESKTEMISLTEQQNEQDAQIDSWAIRSNLSFGRKIHPVAGGTVDGDRHLERSSLPIQCPNVVPDEISHVGNQECPNVPDEISHVGNQELRSAVEVKLWNSMVDEALKMQSDLRGVVLDHEAMQLVVSPVSVELESDDYIDYFKTDLVYQMALSQEPNNPLLLNNYAQFLHLVAHDYNRAEECYKRAVQVEPPDAESLSRYANFLWMVRKDLWGAEERYLQSIAAEPDNSYHASKYANFLWTTGGEETCFPLNTFLHHQQEFKFSEE
ncbi:unnamed protein product [Ilex paraguariensis]|uniref:Uncharacterized protein n=1 Tax=Ilex paraguariensis TaxID=185542 RepID=A0ABC8R115_9AQUA